VKKFEDHFSPLATVYAAFRPQYPPALFDWLAASCRARARAWDCACGSGQATAALAERFGEVVATDASAAQIAAAAPHPRITYRVARAEASGIDAASVDLIGVAQALHWFDLESFYAEARRVARPGAILAAWSYGVMRVNEPDVDALLQRFYGETLDPYWPPERRYVEAGYRTLPFPSGELETPELQMRARWPLGRLLGMLESWSAVARFRNERGEDPMPEIARALGAKWGEPTHEREIAWPLYVRASRLLLS
jgi:SAM-dependent methyltransferase